MSLPSRRYVRPRLRPEVSGMGVAVFVIPLLRRSPEEYSEGPNQELHQFAWLSKRVRSPIAATMVMATVHCTPRRAWRASTTDAHATL